MALASSQPVTVSKFEATEFGQRVCCCLHREGVFTLKRTRVCFGMIHVNLILHVIRLYNCLSLHVIIRP